MTEEGNVAGCPGPSMSGESEHKTLAILVDAWHRAPEGNRDPFVARWGDPERIFHACLPAQGILLDRGHLKALEDDGYVRTNPAPKGGDEIRLTPLAFLTYTSPAGGASPTPGGGGNDG